MQVHNPLPVGGTWNSVTHELRITFDERIASADTIDGVLDLDGTPVTIYSQQGFGTILGRAVSWATVDVGGEPAGPLKVRYIPAGAPITGVGGGIVQAFDDFLLTLL